MHRPMTPLIVALLMATGCASPQRYEAMRHRAEAAEAEVTRTQNYLAGAHQDNAMLQNWAIELEQVIRQYEAGMVLQAIETAKMRQACDL